MAILNTLAGNSQCNIIKFLSGAITLKGWRTEIPSKDNVKIRTLVELKVKTKFTYAICLSLRADSQTQIHTY